MIRQYKSVRSTAVGEVGLFEPQGIQALKSSAVWYDGVIREES
jgi:hypothetical protein